MFEELMFRFRTARLRYERWRIVRSYRKHYLEALKLPPGDKERAIHELRSEECSDTNPIDGRLKVMRSFHLIRIAERLLVPYPEFDSTSGTWEQTGEGNHYLAPAALYQLMVDIRKERAQRSESLRLWLAGLTGLIGALSGLAAVLLRH